MRAGPCLIGYFPLTVRAFDQHLAELEGSTLIWAERSMVSPPDIRLLIRQGGVLSMLAPL